MKWVHRLYVLFVGIILSLTFGFVVSAFYPEPIAPEYPAYKSTDACMNMTTAQYDACQKRNQEINSKQQENQKAYDEKQKVYKQDSAFYNRTTVFFGITVGALFVILGLLLVRASRMVSGGLMAAGVLSAVMTRAFISLASYGLGSDLTAQAKTFNYIELGVMIVLSIAVLILGFSVKEEPERS